jgi:hypothetical protein
LRLAFFQGVTGRSLQKDRKRPSILVTGCKKTTCDRVERWCIFKGKMT